ncbi:MAG: tRNA uridine-5-carboxymethylaminomethyl(34) synthesis enzyme MnmG, partial [Planctomycetota bacterium]
MEEGDVVVVGGGHAGVESALAAARLGCTTVLVTTNYDTIGLMSCNPAIGGLAKGQLVREIDALGGQMGLATDEAMLQFRMLNTKKGLAVRSPRGQCDRRAYAAAVRRALEQQQNLEIVQGLVEEVLIRSGRVAGVVTREGACIRAHRVILATGTFLKGRIWVGDVCYEGGRSGEPAAMRLSE